MKIVLRIILAIVVILIIALTGGWFVAKSSVPSYKGQSILSGLTDSVVVTYDSHGIPHISGNSSEDVYCALGYLMASERLFQMELIRRAGKGELAEVLGRRALESDVFFRTIGVGSHAKRSANDFVETAPAEIVRECKAFLKGINYFVQNGPKPLEFRLAGIPQREFEYDDLYTLAGYIAWSFALAVQTDLLATELASQIDTAWIDALGLDAADLEPHHAVCNDFVKEGVTNFPDFLGSVGIPSFTGSNAWAVNGSRSATGKPILCNDTHIGFSVPQVWYEAAIEWPGNQFYGNFLPGIPYALVGHTAFHGWGLTMFENDDIDFFLETLDTSGNVVFDNGNYPLSVSLENIAIKGDRDTTIEIRSTRHGVIINGAVSTLEQQPLISMYWEYTRGRNKLLEAFRTMNRARHLDEFKFGIKQVHAPGLNVVYADVEDNIAWWSCARIPIRPEGLNPKRVIDGAYAANENLGYFPFEFNPQCENPETGFVFSANEQPAAIDSIFVPGYYVPPTRSKRISKLLAADHAWTVEKMKSVITDVINEDDATIAQSLKAILDQNSELTSFQKSCAELLDWNGSYDRNNPSPVLYQPLQVRMMHNALNARMSERQFMRMTSTHWFRRLMIIALLDENHPVWDHPETTEKETMSHHLHEVFPELCDELSKTYGPKPQEWTWGAAHQYGPKHPFGDIPLIGAWLNLDLKPIDGSNETISQAGFTPSVNLSSSARYGAQMRIIIDFDDPYGSVSVAPTGQSGHRLSPFYKDQYEMYRNGDFRPQHLKADVSSLNLVLQPQTND